MSKFRYSALLCVVRANSGCVSPGSYTPRDWLTQTAGRNRDEGSMSSAFREPILQLKSHDYTLDKSVSNSRMPMTSGTQ